MTGWRGTTLEGHLALRATPTAGGHDSALPITAQALHSSFSPTASAAVTEARLLVGLELR